VRIAKKEYDKTDITVELQSPSAALILSNGFSSSEHVTEMNRVSGLPGRRFNDFDRVGSRVTITDPSDPVESEST